MDTTCTSGHLQQFLRLLDEKKVTPERFTTVLSSGLLADVFDPAAKLDNRADVRTALGFNPPAVRKRKIIGLGTQGGILVDLLQTIRRPAKLTPREYHVELTRKDMLIDRNAYNLIYRPDLLSSLLKDEPQEVEVVMCHLYHDLGLNFREHLTADKSPDEKISRILAAAARLGLRKLPQWAGLQLRLDYDDQPSGEDFTVVTNPIAGDVLFRLERVAKGKRWLNLQDIGLGWTKHYVALALPR